MVESNETRMPSKTDDQHREQMVQLKREQDTKVRERRERKGLIIVNTGDGKGKSTAAFGLALRAIGNGMRVGLVQFIKGTWKTGEKQMFATLDGLDHIEAGEGFTWNTQDRQRDIAAARAGWEKARAMMEECRGPIPVYGLLILDELNVALRYDHLPIDEVVECLKNKPEDLHIAITGRDAHAKLIDVADTVTEMRPVKHAFNAGIRAQRGIEF